MPLPVAVNGTIALQGPARQGDAPQPLTKRAMIVRMTEETLEALAAYPAHPPLQFEFGNNTVCIPHPAVVHCRCSTCVLYPCALRVSTSSPLSSP